MNAKQIRYQELKQISKKEEELVRNSSSFFNAERAWTKHQEDEDVAKTYIKSYPKKR